MSIWLWIWIYQITAFIYLLKANNRNTRTRYQIWKRSHITQSLFPRFLSPLPLCNQASPLSNPPPIIMSTSCEPPPPLHLSFPLPLTKCIIVVFQKPDFPDNSKNYKTKTISKNSILLKPKYESKNAALRNCFRFRFVLLFYSMYLAWEWTSKNLFKFPDLTF